MHPCTKASERSGTDARRGTRDALRSQALSILCLMLVTSTGGSRAETITWVNPGGGNWWSASNWDPQDVPNESGESAIIPAGSGAYTITLDSDAGFDQLDQNNVAATLNLGNRRMDLYQPAGLHSSGTILAGHNAYLAGALTLASTGQLLVPTNVWYYTNGSTHNSGVIRVGSLPSTGSARLYISGYGCALDGPGELVLQTDGNPEEAYLAPYYGSLYQGADHTIRGSGRITLDTHNAGRIDADDSGHVLALAYETQTNNGVFAATNNGILRLDGITVNQGSSGLILADGGIVRIYGGTVTGGTFDSDHNGVIEGQAGCQLYDITTLGRLHVPAGQQAFLCGSAITNDGTIWVNPEQSGDDACLYVANYGLALNGSGDIRLQTSGGDIWDARLPSYYGRLVQTAGHTIHGEGVVGITLNNYGLVSADVSGRTLGIYQDSKDNQAIFQAVGGGTLDVTAPVAQGAAGRILADGGTVRLASEVTGGRLETTGTSTIDCYNGTTFADGTQAGRLRVLQGGCTLRNVTNQGPVAIAGGGQLWLQGATTTNNERITVNSEASGNDAILYVSSYSHNLQGSGDILLQTSGSDIWDARLQGYYGTLIQSAGHTIHGEGVVTVYLWNHGLVSADVNGRTLQLQCENLYNYATCKATGGGVLNVVNPVNQEAPGLLLADGGRVLLRTWVYGGSLATAAGGAVECYSGTYLDHVTNQGRLDIHAGQQVFMTCSFTNNGTVTINSDHTGDDTYFYATGYGQTLDGSGQIVLQTTGDVWDARLEDYYASVTQTASHTIRGDGVVGVYLRNYGTVLADVAGRTLLLHNQEKFNYGTMRAQNGARLEVQTTLTNNGTAEATGGSVFRTSSTINNYASGTLTGGAWLVRPNSTMRLLGANIQQLDARVLLEGPSANLYSDDGTTLVLASLNRIKSAGDLALTGGPSLTTSGDLAVDSGRLTIGAGSTVTVNGAFTQTGNDEADYGRTSVNGTLIVTPGPATVNGGTLSGIGTVQGNVTCGGGMAPGATANSTGSLAIQGDYAQTADGTYWVEIGGTTAGQFDHLQVSGQASLSGRLVVRPAGGYTPVTGQRFTILNCGSRSGEFTLETGAPGVSGTYITHYYADRVEIEIVTDMSSVEEPGIGEDPNPDPGADPIVPVDPITPEPPVPTSVALSARPLGDGRAAVRLDLPAAAEVELSLFDFSGRRVAVLQQGSEGPGVHAYTWDGGRSNPSGIYLARARVRAADEIVERSARVLVVR